MSDDRTIRRVFVRGRVQGVGYRAWVEDQADLLGLDGFVRNCSDGSVEALFAGPSAKVVEMILACRRGPSSAHVTAVEETRVEPEMPAEQFAEKGFLVLPTI